jgi:hypothetical protein
MSYLSSLRKHCLGDIQAGNAAARISKSEGGETRAGSHVQDVGAFCKRSEFDEER